MNDRVYEQSIQIVTKLLKSEVVSKDCNNNLYDAYMKDSDVYDTVHRFMEGFELELIDEYCDSLFISCGITNRAFGYTNEELKRKLRVNNNNELFVIYFLTYVLIIQFYSDSATSTYKSYIRRNEIVAETDKLVKSIIGEITDICSEDNDVNSLRNIAVTWNSIPNYLNNDQEDFGRNRPGVSSKIGYVKKLFQLMKEENLFVEDNDLYYPTDRFHALAQYYFQNKGSEIHECLNNKLRSEQYATD